jgi:hypothetical protein
MDNYIDNIISNIIRILTEVKGPKILLLNEEIKNIINQVLTFRDQLKAEVFFVDLLSNENITKIDNIDCYIIAKPNFDDLLLVTKELYKNNFKSYSLYFTHILDQSGIQQLSEHNFKKNIRTVEELYIDLYPVTKETFIVQQLNKKKLFFKHQYNLNDCQEIQKTIITMILQNQSIPEIRYSRDSSIAQEISKELTKQIPQIYNSFQHFKKDDSILIILDRMDDVITPLLSPWSYDGLIYEFLDLNIEQGIVNLNDGTKQVLSFKDNDFYNHNRTSGWNEICPLVAKLSHDYKQKYDYAKGQGTSTDAEITLKELRGMTNIVPDAKRDFNEMFKHVSLLESIANKMVLRQYHNLLIYEQQMIYHNNPQILENALSDVNIKYHLDDLYRLALLYKLRFEKRDLNINLRQKLLERGLTQDKINSIEIIANKINESRKDKYCGSVWNMISTSVLNFKDLSNSKNIDIPKYKSFLEDIIRDAIDDELENIDYPTAIPTKTAINKKNLKKIILFVLGGVSFEEACLVSRISKEKNIKIMLGSTSILTNQDMLNNFN